MSLAPGTKLGPYEIVSPLGAGGMGEVYRARDPRLGRDVAIKILPKEMSADPVRKQRFEREAKTISGLNHPNICTLHDVGSQDGVDYLVMECVEGETLAKRLQRGALPLEQVLKYGAQIADGLDKAHRAGIVHRDLKPGNIMLTATGAKLLDFGLAKPVAPLGSGLTLTAEMPSIPMTEEGTIVGTFQYMSPEQLEGKDVDGRSDIFSLGAVLFEMLTGRRAFQGKSQLSVASAILESEPELITSLKPLTPPALERTVKKCLAKTPDDRWQSASDLASQLNWIAEGGAPGSVTAGVVVRTSSSWKIYAGLVTLLAIALGGFAWWQSAKPREKSVVRFALTLPASEPALVVGGPALVLSPDGRSMVLVVSHGDSSQLAIRDFSSFDTKLIPGTDGATQPFFSPDGEWLAFFSGGKLRKISVAGGPAIDLANATDATGGTWLPEGTIVFNGEWTAGLLRVSAGGGKPEILTRPDSGRGERWHWWPQALPGGEILFTVKTGEGSEESSIAVLSPKTGLWKTVIDKGYYGRYLPAGKILYVRGDTILAVPFDAKKLAVTGSPLPVLQGIQLDPGRGFAQFAVAQEGTLAYVPGTSAGLRNTLVTVDRTGRETPLGALPRSYEDLSLSPDGKQLALTLIGEQLWNVWIYDLEHETLNRLTFEGDNRDPIWSADGKRVIYFSFRNGHKSLYWKPVTGPGNEEELLTVDSQAYPRSVSRDGRYLSFDIGTSAASTGMYLLPLQGERKAQLFSRDQFALDGMFSPDGKWIAYESAESGKSQVYVSPFLSGSAQWQISTDGGTHPVWSRDGRELFYRNGIASDRLVGVTVSSNPDFSASSPRPLFQFRCQQAGIDYQLLPDGQHFVCIKPPQADVAATEVNVILNWSSEMEKK